MLLLENPQSVLFPCERLLYMNSNISSSFTNWDRLQKMNDEDIDTSEVPEATPEEFARAVIKYGSRAPSKKEQINIHLDKDVLEWFRSQDKGYQSEINALLRTYMHAQQKINNTL